MITLARTARLISATLAILLTLAGVASAAPAATSNIVPPPVFDCNDSVLLTCVQSFPWPSGLDRLDQRSLPVDRRYVYNYTGAGVHIYIVDGGVDTADTQFAGRASNDFTALTSAGSVDHRTCHHATLVAKLAAGTTWGAAKRARLHSVKVLSCSDDGSTSGTGQDVLEGLRWVRQHAQRPAVVNLSLGTTAAATAVNAEVEALINAGIHVVAAAGDADRNACTVSPARVPRALTVAGSDTNDRPLSYSNYGPCVDLFAPGQYVAQTFATGSSYAAGHASGVVAAYLQRDPTLTPATLHSRIIADATRDAMSGIDPNSGTPNRLLYGRVKPPVPPICCI